MFKKIIAYISLIIALFGLSGCTKKILPEEAGILFVNRLIYEDEDERFEKNFVEGFELAEDLKKQRTKLAQDLVTSFNEFGSVLSEAQTKEFMDIWFEKLVDETAYEIKSVSEDKKAKTQTIFFEVYGLDFEQVYKQMMDNLVAQMLSDTNLVKNNAKLGDVTIQLLTEAIAEAKQIKEPVITKVTLKKEKKKWSVVNKGDEVGNLILSFLVGVDNLDSYAEVIGGAVTSSMDEARAKVEAELAGKEVPAKKEPKKETTKTSESKEETKESTLDSQMSVSEETLETYADEK